ncbi:ADP-ribosylation/crystallin J1 [Xanthomonas vesicatoria ATCC 35937]|nr:hypothetical protein [Xanthomonas vesicatoria]APO97140.1 ADP-ribosylation/crystallin J1 [Xanthomonas vesicatoria]APP78059.1 ADP-ribosylation/crystallin J1 [Xanthomonas vesicatoria ATCC 35937]MDG4483576.1 ADP-ribosylation/crystallin J1 [Xanthomonas vesicatoria]MDG4487940.1 ADP-ribosylation/crystallin J1 [Xanthomonas vesicatoria]MDG4493789.1 ADP-ribosylation/crystallin J1 [Xanthomonas vesicatoria]
MHRPLRPEQDALVRVPGFRRWPPRLPEQPGFPPATDRRYAGEIASRWNVKDSGVGDVAQFAALAAFVDQYAMQTVGGAHHTEWWIPAEDFDKFNAAIVGSITIIARFDAPPAEPRP